MIKNWLIYIKSGSFFLLLFLSVLSNKGKKCPKLLLYIYKEMWVQKWPTTKFLPPSSQSLRSTMIDWSLIHPLGTMSVHPRVVEFGQKWWTDQQTSLEPKKKLKPRVCVTLYWFIRSDSVHYVVATSMIHAVFTLITALSCFNRGHLRKHDLRCHFTDVFS